MARTAWRWPGDGAAERWRGDRARVVAALQAAPEADLRRHYLQCAFASNERLLAPEESILCVLVADALLQRAFAGDFAALIAWYQRNREPALAEAALSASPVHVKSTKKPKNR